MMDKEELKFKFREWMVNIKIMFRYLFKEPFLEVKRVMEGYYNSILLFWITVILGIKFWRDGVGGLKIKIVIILIIVSYIYMFFKSGRWKEYYQKEYIEGKEIE